MSKNTTASASASFARFEARVLERTGTSLADIREGDENDVVGGHIVAHDPDTNTFVVFVGHPEGQDEGRDFWNPAVAARKVHLV